MWPLTLFYPDNLSSYLSSSIHCNNICDGTEKLKPFTHVENILVRHYSKHSSSKYTSYVSIILLTDVNLWTKLYKQQNIDSLSIRDCTSGFYCDQVIVAYTKQKYMSVVMWGISFLSITPVNNLRWQMSVRRQSNVSSTLN